MNDQAAALREMVAARPREAAVVSIGPRQAARAGRPLPARSPVPALARAIAVTSGKGGVGKSNLAVNLAVAMSGLGLKVCLLDADLGLANADVLCNLTPRLTLQHVLAGECRLADAAMLAPGAFRLIPGASGVAQLADLDQGRRGDLLVQLEALEQVADVLLIDTGAGIASNVVAFAAAAHAVVVLTTPEPTAITDSYGMIKSLLHWRPHAPVQVVVNMARDAREGGEVFQRLDRVSRTFLGHALEHGGTIPQDAAVPAAVRERIPFVLLAPDAACTGAVRGLARRLAGVETPDVAGGGFLRRLASWLGFPEVEPSADIRLNPGAS